MYILGHISHFHLIPYADQAELFSVSPKSHNDSQFRVFTHNASSVWNTTAHSHHTHSTWATPTSS